MSGDDFMLLGPTASAVWSAVLVVPVLSMLLYALWMQRRHGTAAPEPAATSFRGWAVVFALVLGVVVVASLGKFFLILLVGERIDTEVIDTSSKRTNNKGQITETFVIEARAADPDDPQIYGGEIGEDLYYRIFRAEHALYRKGDRVEVHDGLAWSAATIQEDFAQHPSEGVDLQRVLMDDRPTDAARWVNERRIRLPPRTRSETLRVPFMVVPGWRSIHQVGDTPGLDDWGARIGLPLLLYLLVGIGYAAGRPRFD